MLVTEKSLIVRDEITKVCRIAVKYSNNNYKHAYQM